MPVRNVSCTGTTFFRTVGLIQYSWPEGHPNDVKWTVTKSSRKCMVVLDLTFIIREGPLEYTAYRNSGSYICALQICKGLNWKLCDNPSGEGILEKDALMRHSESSGLKK